MNGPDHPVTLQAETYLIKCKQGEVYTKWRGELRCFQLVGCEENGEKCVLKGPLEKPGKIDEEEMVTVPVRRVIAGLHTSVVCHGLTGPLAHLNGKVGDVRGFGTKTFSYEIHFEDRNIEPRMVGMLNARVIFELPDEEA